MHIVKDDKVFGEIGVKRKERDRFKIAEGKLTLPFLTLSRELLFSHVCCNAWQLRIGSV